MDGGCTPIESVKTVWNCTKCYPRLCSCPLTREAIIDARLLCLAEDGWNESEREGFRTELAKMMTVTERKSRIQACLNSDEYGPLGKARLKEELVLLETEG